MNKNLQKFYEFTNFIYLQNSEKELKIERELMDT
jgi:hypothetical protein